jgi:hypothetical protein
MIFTRPKHSISHFVRFQTSYLGPLHPCPFFPLFLPRACLSMSGHITAKLAHATWAESRTCSPSINSPSRLPLPSSPPYLNSTSASRLDASTSTSLRLQAKWDRYDRALSRTPPRTKGPGRHEKKTREAERTFSQEL